MSFSAWSTSVRPGQKIPDNYIFDGFGCSGKNISPELKWKDAPPGTKSFAVTMFDPDAPQIGGWWHWTVINIPPSVTHLEEGASNNKRLPKEAIEVESDYGSARYGGPCPPKGDNPHHYVFTVYALKHETVHLSPNSTAASVKNELEHDCLAKSSFTVEYGR